jgi:hypothetical protein
VGVGGCRAKALPKRHTRVCHRCAGDGAANTEAAARKLRAITLRKPMAEHRQAACGKCGLCHDSGRLWYAV